MPLRQLRALRGVLIFCPFKISMDKYDFGAFYYLYFWFWFYSKYKKLVFRSSNTLNSSWKEIHILTNVFLRMTIL